MSRNTSKNQAEKVTSAKPPPPTQAEDVEDSVDLGCLTKSEFLTMIAHEEGEEIVSDILDELMTNVMEKCYEVYLKKQVINLSGGILTLIYSKTILLMVFRNTLCATFI